MKSLLSIVLPLSLIALLIVGCNNSKTNVTAPRNQLPVIQSLTADADTVLTEETAQLHCEVSDADDDTLMIIWSAVYGSFPAGTSGENVAWKAPAVEGAYYISVIVFDGEAGVTDSISIYAILPENNPPQIISMDADPAVLPLAGTAQLSCQAGDDDGDTLTYAWTADEGSFTSGSSESQVNWMAPSVTGQFVIRVTVDDGRDQAQDSVVVAVNGAPGLPHNPSPSDGTVGLPLNITLSWECSDPEEDTLTYNIYLGTNSKMPLIQTHYPDQTYDAATLEPNAVYRWRIDAYDQYNNKTTGPVWTFTTSE